MVPSSERARLTRASRRAKSMSAHWSARTSPSRRPVRARQRYSGVEARLLALGRREEGVGLPARERLHRFLAGLLRDDEPELPPELVGRVHQEHAVVDGRVEHGAQGRVDDADGPARETRGQLVREQCLHPRLVDPAELRLPERRQDVEPERVVVRAERARLQRSRDEAERPLRVVRDGHVRVDGQARVLPRLPQLLPRARPRPGASCRMSPVEVGT